MPVGNDTATQMLATIKDRTNASLRSCSPMIAAYHFSENPSGGNVMIFHDVKEAPKTTSVGADNIRIETTTSDQKTKL